MSAAAKIPVRMTVDEFLAWADENPGRWELVDGEPRAMTAANRIHGSLQGELARLIGNHLRDRRSPCALVVAPGVVPHLLSAYNMRVPDLAVTWSDYEREEQSLTDPVLIAEILSPSNQADTWANVWTYTTIPSLREILILKSLTIGAEVLRRQPDGTWPDRTDIIADGQEFVLDSIEFRIALADLYATTRLARR